MIPEGGLRGGFAAGGEAARRKTPSFHPLPSPAAEGERERGTNDSEIFMNLGAGGGVRARFFETLARYDFIGLNNLHL
jgi:hypothetical protein